MSARVELICHPATPCDPIRRIGVQVTRATRTALVLSYRIEGEIWRLRLPEAAMPHRADGLWQHSCFEAFLRADGCQSYFEFNFAPSGAWAAYRFDGRRAGRALPELTTPEIELGRRSEALVVSIDLSFAGLPELVDTALLSAGLAAVIEDEDGALSYWALAHGAARPDFHDPATFGLRIPAP